MAWPAKAPGSWSEVVYNRQMGLHFPKRQQENTPTQVGLTATRTNVQNSTILQPRKACGDVLHPPRLILHPVVVRPIDDRQRDAAQAARECRLYLSSWRATSHSLVF